ncbi:hypothetical protein C8J56DRAFT_806824 [Mycena floridula]|nr:hypothetical protein C8J56DRAFT_806824 [Mycena floridula]
MYSFCKVRKLREVWGYMWRNWYSPLRWKLWARSSCPERLSRLRTTMNVENFWRRLKHDYLHHLVHPRLDQLVWILIYKVTPAQLARMEIHSDEYRLGRAKPLTNYQKYFKAAWRRLSQRKINHEKATIYQTDVASWTCRCGQQKYDAFCLCKHLVQAVKPPSISFWGQVSRRRTQPIYRHPELRSRDSATFPSFEVADGSISDGDDKLWLGDVAMLSGDGDWEDLSKRSTTFLGKRRRDDNAQSHRSSPITEARRSSPFRSSSPIGYGSDDEHQRDNANDYVRSLIKDLRFAADALETQLSSQTTDENPILFKALQRKKFGKDITKWVGDIRHSESTGRVRGTTWGRAGDFEATRRSQNTMGYRPRAGNGSAEGSSGVE